MVTHPVTLADLLGARGPFIRWERLLLFSAALVVANLATFATGYGVSQSTDAGFYVEFRTVSPWLLVFTLAAQIAESLALIVAFRLVRQQYLALLATAVGYGLLYTPVRIWLFRFLFGPMEAPWISIALPRFAISACFVLVFYGTLMLALSRLRPLGMALFVGATLGFILSGLALALVQAATRAPHFSIGISLGFAVWEGPEKLVEAALFAGLLIAGLRFSRTLDDEGAHRPRLRHASYVGSAAALGGTAVGVITLSRGLSDLGPWRPGLSSSSDNVGRLQQGVAVLTGFGVVFALAATVVFLVVVYRMWAAIQDGHVRISPGRAVGLLFVPVYSFYWVFVVFLRFRREYNGLLQRYRLTIRPLPLGLFLGIPVLALVSSLLSPLPFVFVVLVPQFAFGLLLISRVCDAVNALPHGWPAPSRSAEA